MHWRWLVAAAGLALGGVGDAAPGASDVAALPERTDARGEVFAIGKPRLQLAQHETGELAVSASGKRVFADDRGAIKIWDLETGELVQRIEVGADGRVAGESPALRAAADGSWLAMGYGSQLGFRRVPFDKDSFAVRLATPVQFGRDGKQVACIVELMPAIVDLVQQKVVARATSPDPRRPRTLDLRIADDGRSVYWAHDRGVLRWDPASGKLEPLYASPGRLSRAAIAPRALVAVVFDGKALSRVDLASGATTPLPVPGTPLFAMAPGGQRIAVLDHRAIRVIDLDGGKELASIKLAGAPARIAFSDDDNLLAYLEGQTLRVVDVGKGLRAYDAPSRFAGWLGEGVVAIQRAGKLAQFTLASRALAASDAGALVAASPKPSAGAPGWASWLAPGPGGGVVAAEPSDRHAAPWLVRDQTACAPKLRVWTARGGARTLALKRRGKDAAAGHDDPCWDIGGGWAVGVSTDTATVYDPATGKAALTADVGRPRVDRPELAHQYHAVALSPTGGHVALVWRRADVWGTGPAADPREDAMHLAERKLDCDKDAAGNCAQEYFAEVWSLAGTPKRLWQTRFDSAVRTARTWPLAKLATGAPVFTHDGQRVVFGFDDGDIEIRAVAGGALAHVEHLHHASVVRIEVSPGDGWVFSEDASGEQRVWQLPP